MLSSVDTPKGGYSVGLAVEPEFELEVYCLFIPLSVPECSDCFTLMNGIGLHDTLLLDHLYALHYVPSLQLRSHADECPTHS